MWEARVNDLEIRYTHQQQYLEQLNEIVTAQQITIQRLEKDILDIRRNLNAEGVVDGNRSLSDERPPHY